MTYEEADNISCAFAGVLAEQSKWILEARLLPHSKQTIRCAFQCLIRHYESIRSADYDRFMRDGLGEALEQARALSLRVADFQAIDPQDQELVQAYNSGPRIQYLADRLDNEQVDENDRVIIESYCRGALALFSKYHSRSMTE